MAIESPPAADPAALASQWLALLTKAQADSQAMFAELLKQPVDGAAKALDPLNVAPAMQAAATQLMLDPARLMQANVELWQSHMALWQQAAAAMAGQPIEPVVEPEPGDRRFRHPDWDANPFFALVKQSYLITSRWLVDTMAGVSGLDPAVRRRVRADQLSVDQSRGAAGDHRQPGAEPGAGHAELPARPRARRGPAAHHDV
jgi:polyhydroxyalkanoate synthase